MCALPVFAWSIYSYLYAFPGFVLRLSAWDLIGTISYALAFDLIESLIITFPFILLAIVLPGRIYRKRFVSLTAVLVIVSSIWIVYSNYHQINLADLNASQLLVALGEFVISAAIPVFLVTRYKRLEGYLLRLVERVSVLVYIYSALACAGLLIVVIRNI